MARKAILSPVEQMEIRLNREAGVCIKDAAALAGVSQTTALRILAKLRKKLGPEKFKGDHGEEARQRARSQLFVSNASSHNPTSNSR